MTAIHVKPKFIATLLFIVALPIYFFENIHGYYEFKAICKKEAGLHVFDKLEKNVGWVVKNNHESYAQGAAGDGVLFVRYKNNDGLLYDIKYTGGNRYSSKSFTKSPSDPNKTPIYEWRTINERVPNQIRLSKSGYEILSISDQKILVSFYNFGYSVFNQNSTILGAPSGESCGEAAFWTSERANNIYNQGNAY